MYRASVISKISSNQKLFNESVNQFPYTKKPLLNLVITIKQIFWKLKTSTKNTKRRQQKRNIICFNPPFSKSLVTKIDKTFLRLIEKHFPPHHKLRKLSNQNNVKTSYSCMLNVKWIIKKHNKTVLDPPTNTSERT